MSSIVVPDDGPWAVSSRLGESPRSGMRIEKRSMSIEQPVVEIASEENPDECC
jgi:hypothetical protein